MRRIEFCTISKCIWILLLLLSSLLVVSTSVYSEIADGVIARNKLSVDVRVLLHEEKYEELEKIANEFRTGKTRFPDGGWKIRQFYRPFGNPYYGWGELFRNLDRWLKKYPNSVTARVATAEAWSSFAWEARGKDYARTVTEEGWKLMRERMAKAYDLVKNPPDDPSKDCVHRYHLLLWIANAQGWDRQKYEELFQKAITFEPLYYTYYLDKAYYLLPRWHGEEGEWQRFANEAVNLTPKSEGMGIYTRILIQIWAFNEFTAFREPDISWKKMKQGFLDIERNYPNSMQNLNAFCMFACIAGDKETARGLFKRIGNMPYAEVWSGRSNYEKWRKWAGVVE